MNAQIDVLVIGSCMTDLICYTPRLPKPGETICGDNFRIGFGGKGANQCIAAAKLGASCALLAKLGNDTFGKSYMDYLKETGIDIQHVKMIDNAPSGVAQICVSKKGENSIVIIPGANEHLTTQDIDEAEESIKVAKVVLFQFETPIEITRYALNICRKYKCTTIVNGAPAVADVDSEILRLADIFCVNEIEAETVTGIPISKVEDASLACRKLQTLGCKLPLITLGSLGAVYASVEESEPVHVPVAQVSNPVDTTGAGDAFLGAIAYLLSKSAFNIEKVFYACKIASVSVLKHGTQSSFPTNQDIVNILGMEI